MTSEQRDSYANLILLCRHHHALIDLIEEKYPVELLHQIKTEHEQWVIESLGKTQGRRSLGLRSDHQRRDVGLTLDGGTGGPTMQSRDLLPTTVADKAEIVEVRRLATIWPGKYPALNAPSLTRWPVLFVTLSTSGPFASFGGPTFLGRTTLYSVPRLSTFSWSGPFTSNDPIEAAQREAVASAAAV